MGFNPLEEKGIPLDKQLRNWSELNTRPYDKREVHPYTRTRIIALNGIEVEGVLHSHQFARHCPIPEVRRSLAVTRRIEQQQQKAVNWLIPADETTLEVTIGYEQVAVDLTAYLARTEPDAYVEQALEFGLLEDFDHLYRYANLMALIGGHRRAEEITGELTEILPGRPTISEHRHPHDDVRRPIDGERADPLTKLHLLTITAAEQQTMNFYMTIGNRPLEPLARALYLEIGQIEEQHVTHYESLLDPTESWFEGEVLHQYNECYLYHSFMTEETDPRIKQLWELHLAMEIEQLKAACELMRKHEGRDPEQILPKRLPEPTRFQSNIDYVRDVLRRQIDLTGRDTDFVPMDRLSRDDRYFDYQAKVHGDGDAAVPSQRVIADRIGLDGEDYRQSLEGEHPVERFRDRTQVRR